MKPKLRERFGAWLQQFTWTHWALLKYSHEYNGKHYINRISRQMVSKD